ncbi:4-hydroxythreonine-4-phosphate dehydrogenase PdxA [Fonticella tunisiensis]|uniref:Putative D-threonate 4-phosphate dehydrogenase n=1 Tax=Fonticella tunisiensis TaxID=1096341 RepID=A0A4R7KTX3_9CLOT|nr:4-hydroxythreonine-4-phosphate dehydrogenase PdxA [Fonticella tunisiensis]TDT62791.1 4-hydroxythreonine-4-phosphate dehydrogenase [Fonticella tunisiensis]
MYLIGITMGDPAGVGPEVTLKAITSKHSFKAQYVIYGSVKVIEYYRNLLGIELPVNKISRAGDYKGGRINVIDVVDIAMEDFEIGKVSPKCGDAAFRYVEAAVKDALEGDIRAVVTAPLNKEALHLGGHNFDGHTEIFAKLTNTSKYSMMLFGGPLKVIHVSTHTSLRNACDRVKKERVFDVINLANDTLKKMGIKEPRIAVAGLNPHAGESGIFGDEEIKEITPAIEMARENGINAEGPVPPDTVFLKAVKGKYDIVVVMYHDQGHIPVKLLGFDTGVNMTVGLPIIRTSVDHGTAFDIAGKGIADEKSMIEAMKTAEMFN